MDCQATSHISVPQCDFTSTTDSSWPLPAHVGASCPAKRLLPQQRQDLAIQALAGTETVSALAREHEVSRKFLYQQVHTAEEALNQAFAPSSTPDDVLFYLPVTKAWLRQLVLALVLICHSSTRGVVELLRDLFDYRISFCFLLSLEEHRDADTWGTRLLDLVDRGFAPEATIADFASGLRAGHHEALPGCPCRGDVFHALYDVGPLVRYLENRAYETIAARAKLERKQATAERRRGRKDQSQTS
jgi:hypothetical protein